MTPPNEFHSSLLEREAPSIDEGGEYELSARERILQIIYSPLSKILQVLGVDREDSAGSPARVVEALQKTRMGVGDHIGPLVAANDDEPTKKAA